MPRPVALLLVALAVVAVPVGATTLSNPSPTEPSSIETLAVRQTTGLTDVAVTTSPSVAYQRATWTVEATVSRDANVTAIDLDIPGGAPEHVTPSDVRVGYTPPVNATFVMLGSPDRVTVRDNGSLRLAYPGGIELENGSRLTVHVEGVRVPAEPANVTLAVTTPDAGYAATDSVDPAPVPHLQFYESFPEPGVHLRFGLPKDVSMLAVVFHEGEVVGTEYLDYDYAMTADGQPVPVEGVGGRVELTVRGYYDANDNGVYDPDVDRPFVDQNGDPIGETAEIDLGGTTNSPPDEPTTTTSVSHQSPTPGDDTTTTTTSTPTQVDTPGFGLLASLLALLAGVCLLVRD